MHGSVCVVSYLKSLRGLVLGSQGCTKACESAFIFAMTVRALAPGPEVVGHAS